MTPLQSSVVQGRTTNGVAGKRMKRTATALLTLALFAATAQAEDKLFWTLAAGAQTAAIYDVETTVRTLRSCTTCYEANPLMKPFVGSRSTAYSVSVGLSAVSTYGSFKLKERRVRWWFVPLVGQI